MVATRLSAIAVLILWAAPMRQLGRRAEAEARFREAEQMQAAEQPAYTRLYSAAGFRYCDLLLTKVERAAWQQMQKSDVTRQ